MPIYKMCQNYDDLQYKKKGILIMEFFEFDSSFISATLPEVVVTGRKDRVNSKNQKDQNAQKMNEVIRKNGYKSGGTIR